jgi:putative oxidoreductase
MNRWKAVLDTQAQPAMTLLRIALGAIMFPHGAQHALGWFGGYGFKGTLDWMVSVGFPAPLAALAIITELLAPIALVLGIATRVAAVGVAGIMAGAILTHIPNGFFMNWVGSMPAGKEGFEYHLLVVVMSAVLIIQGSGALSVDRWLLNHQPNGRALTRLGLFSLVLLLTACSYDEIRGPIGGPQPVASLNIDTDTFSLYVGDTRVLQARARGVNGNVMTDRPMTSA